MPNIAQIRQQYPQYSDLSDQQLSDKLHAAFYSDVPKAQFEDSIGLGGPGYQKALTAARANVKANNPTETGRSIRAVGQGALLGFGDELNGLVAGGLTAAQNFAADKLGIGKNTGYSAADAARATQRATSEDLAAFHQRQPLLDTGLQLAGGLATPGLGEAASFVSGAKGLAGAVGRSALVGGGLGAVAGAGNTDGDLSARLQGGLAGGAAGLALGAATPALVAGASRVGGFAADAASRFGLGSRDRSTSGLVDALTRDGATPEQIDKITANGVQAGASPGSLVDIASQLPNGGEHTIAYVRGAASKGLGRSAAQTYQNGVADALQDNVQNAAEQLRPEGALNQPAVNDASVATISDAGSDLLTPPNSGGESVYNALNAGYDNAKAGVKAAYDKARSLGPDQAQVPADQLPQIDSAVRSAVQDFDPADTPSLTSKLDRLTNLNAPTVRDLFDIRTQIGKLRSDPLNPVQAGAASNAVRALDGEIDRVSNSGLITGDPNSVQAWRDAIATRRQFGQTYEGGDLIQKLTERAPRSGRLQNVVSPEDAGNVIFGRNGVTPSANLGRDLDQVSSVLGGNHPALADLQAEALSRLVQPHVGTENLGANVDRLQTQAPDVANRLLSEQGLRQLADAQASVQNAVANRSAAATGKGVLTTPPTQFTADVSKIGPNALPLAQSSGVDAIQNAVGAPSPGAVGVINRLGNNNRTTTLDALYGPQASRFQEAARLEALKATTAASINPNTGSQTFQRLVDSGALELPPSSKTGLLLYALNKLRRGVPLSDAENGEVVKAATNPDVVTQFRRLLAQRQQNPQPAIGRRAALAATSVSRLPSTQPAT